MQTKTQGWQAQLHLGFQRQALKTVLAKRQRRGPLAVQRPFYPTDDDCHCYLLHPPGGVVGGDTLDIQVQMDTQADALITTPGATKFYRSQANTATQTQALTLNDESVLTWFPQENIFFPGAMVSLQTHIELAVTAKFVGWEINCFGQPANQVSFTTGRVNTQFAIYRQQLPLLLERQSIYNDRLNEMPGLQHYPVNAIFIATPVTQDMCDACRLITVNRGSDKLLSGITLIDNLLVVRVLAHYADPVKDYLTDLWRTLYPDMMNKNAIPPRIWAT